MKQIVVISGKGGTGKTSITAALAGVGPNKVLADCDVDAADLHLVLNPEIVKKQDFVSGELPSIDPEKCIACGQCREHCRFDAITPEMDILMEHCEGCGVCEYVCPTDAVTMHPRTCGEKYQSTTRFGTMIHASLGIGEENSGKLVTSVRADAKEMAEKEDVDYVLVDGSPGVGCPVIASLTAADLAVLVAEPTMSAIHDLQRVHALTKHFRLPAAVIVNKQGINAEQEAALENYCDEQNIPIIGTLPYTMTFTKAQIAQQTLAEYDPNGLGQSIEALWEKIEVLLDQEQVQ